MIFIDGKKKEDEEEKMGFVMGSVLKLQVDLGYIVKKEALKKTVI